MLNQVVSYALHEFPEMEPGFGPVVARWRITIHRDLSSSIEPFGGESGSVLSKCPEYPDNLLQGGGKSNFLVDTLQVMLLYLDKKDKPEKYNAKHDYFVSLLKNAAQEIPDLLLAVEYFSNQERLIEAQARMVELGAKSSDKAFFVVDGFNPIEDAMCQGWWRTLRKRLITESVKKPKTMVCLLSGVPVTPAQTHPKISGLKSVGGRGQDIVVGYDKKSFESFQLEQSENGAMSESMANAYAKGLDDLIRNHSKKLANALVVHWFKDQITQEDDPLEWLNGFETPENTEAVAQAAARRLLDSIRSGGEHVLLGDNRYYALTLSGASGRVMVRDWMEGRFEDLVRNVQAWFVDHAVVKWDGSGLALDPKFYEVCLGLVRNDRKKSISKNLEQLPATSVSAIWKSAVQRLPIPRPLLAQALMQFRAERFTPDDRNREVFYHARMGLIKAYFVRLKLGGDPAMTAYLNPEHPDPAYHCGRLLAVLANLQRAALGDVGAGVVQRYYAAASQTPGLILGRLASNARNHLGKLEGGLAYWYENKIADVMSQLGDRAPRILDLEGQGLFALGYYQQLASMRAGSKDKNTTTNTTEQGKAQ